MEREKRKENESPMDYLCRLTDIYHDKKLEWADFHFLLQMVYSEGSLDGRLFACGCIKEEIVRLCPELGKIEVDEDEEQKIIAGELFERACDRYREMMKEMEGKSFKERRDAINRFRVGYK